MRRILWAALLSLASTVVTAAELPRGSVVLGVGEEALYTSRVSIATVSAPPGAAQQASGVVKFVAQQYGNNVALRGLKKGETKLLVESTAARVEEVLHVTVVDPATAARYKSVASAMTNVDGVAPSDILVSPNGVLVTGTTFSMSDHNRCLGMERESGKVGKGKKAVASTVVCAARPNSAIVVVANGDLAPQPSVSIREEFAPATGDVPPGTEGNSLWVAEFRFGDVPFAEIASPSRSVLVDKAIAAATRLRKASAEWKQQAEQRNRVYPVLVAARRSSSGYELAMQYRLDQGTKGETILDVTFDELQHAVRASGSTSDRIIEWWAAALQDTFRLYYLASTPMRTPGGDGALLALYRNAVAIDGNAMNRANAPAKVARGYTAQRWAAGRDPFDKYAVKVPSNFEPKGAGAP